MFNDYGQWKANLNYVFMRCPLSHDKFPLHFLSEVIAVKSSNSSRPAIVKQTRSIFYQVPETIGRCQASPSYIRQNIWPTNTGPLWGFDAESWIVLTAGRYTLECLWRLTANHCGMVKPMSDFGTNTIAGIILGMGSANGRWRYNVTSSLIGWAHAQNDLWTAADHTVFWKVKVE